MPVIKFTELSLQHLRSETQTRYWDAAFPSFGILVGKKRKTFFVVTGERRKLQTLGRFPNTKLQDARRAAITIMEGTEATEDAKKPEDRVDDYIHQLQASQKYRYEQERLLRKYFLPSVKTLPAVTKKDILAITDTLSGTPSEQLHCHRAMRAFFAWCLSRDYVQASPVAGLNSPSTDKKRSRVLTPQEMRQAYYEADFPASYRRVMRICMLLGTRKTETTAICREWLTPDGLLIPPDATKNGHALLLPLTPLAKKRIDELIENEKPNWNSWNKYKKKAKLGDWTVHDIRRSFRTLLAKIGTPPHIGERIVNHISSQTEMEAIYDQYKYLPEMKQTLEHYENHLATILGDHLHS